MAAQIRPNAMAVTDRRPMLSFTIRVGNIARVAEVVMATDPALFTRKEGRTSATFYSSREQGLLAIPRGEAVFMVPPAVLSRFVGANRIWFGLATASSPSAGDWTVDVVPTADSPYVSLSGLSDRALRRVRMFPGRGTAGAKGSMLEWAGDMRPGSAPVLTATAPGAVGASPQTLPSAPATAPGDGHYDDGFGPLPPLPSAPAMRPAQAAAPASPAKNPAPAPTMPPAQAVAPAPATTTPAAQGLGSAQRTAYGWSRGLSSDPEAYGIETPPYSDDDSSAGAAATASALSLGARENSLVTRTAASPSFDEGRGGTAIDRIVIHIADVPSVQSVVNTFTNPASKVSAHYLVGQAGEVVQFVSESDTAWHCKGSNRRSIGIEHVAVKRGGADYPRRDGGTQHFDALAPTQLEYETSAALVASLCDKYRLPVNRSTIMGHREADPSTGHSSCPDGNWDWDYFMRLVASRTCQPQDASQALALLPGARTLNASGADTLVFANVPGNWHTVDYPHVALTSVAWASAPDTPVAYVFFGHPNIDFDGSPTAYHPNDTGDDVLANAQSNANNDPSNGPNRWVGVYALPPSDPLVMRGAVQIDQRPERELLGKFPVIQQAGNGDPAPGYYVSTTSWTADPSQQPYQQRHYLDASTVPFGALDNKLGALGLKLGDCGLAIRHDKPLQSAFFFADGGGSRFALGEGSQKVGTNLGGSGRGSRFNNNFPVSYIVFPRSGTVQKGPVAESDVNACAAACLAQLAQAANARDLALLMAANEVAPGTASPGKAGLDRALSGGRPAPRNLGNVATGLGNFGYRLPVAGSQAQAQGLSQSRAQSRALDADDWSINWDDVQMTPQPTDMGCWATAAAMVTGWRDNQSVDPTLIARYNGMDSSLKGGLAPQDKRTFSDAIGLVVHPNACYTPDGFRQILEANGPIWVTADVPGIHAIVVTGMYRQNGQYYVRITDPWDRVVGTPGAQGSYLRTHATGSRYIMGWDAFTAEFEAAGSIDRIQLLHSGGTFGHTINRGSAVGTGYAQALGARALDADDWTVNWDEVQLIPQPTDMGCWATSASMVIGWRDRQSVDPSLLARCVNLEKQMKDGLQPAEVAAFANASTLTVEPNACFSADGFRQLLENNGPIWVAAVVTAPQNFFHAVVVTGMYRKDGQYFVRICDPLDRVIGTPGNPGARTIPPTHATGSRYIMTYADFVSEFEAAAGIGVLQLLHSGGTFGHSINRGSAAGAGYALGLEPQPSGGEFGFGVSLSRRSSSTAGRTYDLAQLSGLVQPDNSLAGGAGQPRMAGQRIVLDDWPYIDGPGGRTAAPVSIDWAWQGGAVGDVAISPAAGQVIDGWTATVCADISRAPGTPEKASLKVRITSTFRHAGEEDQVAVSEVVLTGDGRFQTRHGVDASPPAPARVAPERQLQPA